MDTLVEDGAAEPLLARLDACVDGLFELGLDGCSDDDVLAVWQRLEVVSRRLAAVDHRVIAQVRDRNLPFTHGATSVVALARQVLRVSPREAKARVCGADAAGPRTALTGEALGPIYGEVAAAQAAGAISPAHARVVVDTIDRLPDAVQQTHAAAAEATLVQYAHDFDPDTLTKIARRLTDHLDPDGRLTELADRERHRGLRVFRRADGSSRWELDATAELTEHLNVALDSLARPAPSVDGVPDARTPAQRNHDALLELVTLSERAELLPNAGGVTATLVLTVPAEDWAKSTGTARTAHGVVIPTAEARRWISGDTKVIGVAIDRFNNIQAYTDCQRIFTENQRLAMIARDKGCAFPGCDAPPQRCQAHHITEWAHGGRTTIGNGCLLCAYHHREYLKMGWQIRMTRGRPEFIPPKWLDPERRPKHNTMHDPTELMDV